MRRSSEAMVTTCLAALAGCALHVPPSSSATGSTDVQVVAKREVRVTQDPLGDVVLGRLRPGQDATAVCFVEVARTNAGLFGSAVRIATDNSTGFAAATDFATPVEQRKQTFDLGEADLRAKLPPCPR